MRGSTATSEITLHKPQAGTNPLPGTVQVSVFVPASNDEVWEALTERKLVGRWFGDLSDSLNSGGKHRLDFGDGDFFEIKDVALNPPRGLSYRWRFLGTGPSNAISWTIEPTDEGSRVTVTDREDDRSQTAVDELTEGWTDFLTRLQGYCANREITRYAWRRQFDGAIELPADADAVVATLLTPEGQRRWMPWSADAIAEGSVARMTDSAQPASFEIGCVQRIGPHALRFTLSCPAWRAPTVCTLEIQPRVKKVLLVVTHNGWEGIGDDDSEQGAQRERFGTLWAQALHEARRVVAGDDSEMPS